MCTLNILTWPEYLIYQSYSTESHSHSPVKCPPPMMNGQIKIDPCQWKGRKERFLFNDAFNTFYMASDMWLRTIHRAREETFCCHYMGYSVWIAAKGILYIQPHREDITYHSLCYTSHGALWRIDLITYCTMNEHSYYGATSCFPCQWVTRVFSLKYFRC